MKVRIHLKGPVSVYGEVSVENRSSYSLGTLCDCYPNDPWPSGWNAIFCMSCSKCKENRRRKTYGINGCRFYSKLHIVSADVVLPDIMEGLVEACTVVQLLEIWNTSQT